MASRSSAIFLLWVALCGAHLALSARHLDLPGPYYDEVVQAGPAQDFLSASWRLHVPGSKSVALFGRPFPWLTQVYMGALKSQALIPSFSFFGSDLSVLRLTTTIWSLMALLFVMLWTQRVLGEAAAVCAGLLLAFDPSLLFVSRTDWGSASLALLCRALALFLATRWWVSRRPWQLVGAGLALGLGLYNKADFVTFPLAAGAALLLCNPTALRLALTRHTPSVVAALVVMLLAATPILAQVGQAAAAADAVRERADLGLQLQAAWSVLDGSYYTRLQEVGGRFERMFEAGPGPRSLLGIGFVLSLGIALLTLARSPERPAALAFVTAASLLLLLGLLAVPGASRIHHLMNAYPFPQLVVAATLASGWRAQGRRWRALGRSASVLGLAAILASNLAVIRETFLRLEATGGQGWWSQALASWAAGVSTDRDAVVVSLDWGFNEQLLFLTDGPRLVEPIWQLARGDGASWVSTGGREHIYLVHDPGYDLFGLGPRFLEALADLPPGAAEVERHLDRAGGVAFLSVRFAEPHRIRYDGTFHVHVASATPPSGRARGEPISVGEGEASRSGAGFQPAE